jgi:hypothetical protein
MNLKFRFLIPPAIALALVAIWIGRERSSISVLEQERAVLKQRLAALASGSETDAASSKAKSPDPLAKEKAPIDWKKMAAQLAEMGGSLSEGEVQSYLRLVQKFSALSKEELISALDEIATLDVPIKSRQMLQSLVLGPLCEKDPEYALTHYLSLMDDQNETTSRQLAIAMAGWARKNPTAAIAWFDQQITAGKLDSRSLDGKSPSRMQFEGSLIVALNSTDPAAALARLKSLPEDQRADSLRGTGYDLKDEDQLAYANLIRNGLPEKAQTDYFEWQIQIGLRAKAFTEITEYLDRIKATPAERAICVEEAATSQIARLSQNKKVTREDLDAMRGWATSQAPGTTDKVTGIVLARSTQANQPLEFPEAAALATQYHEASGNDDVLIGFLMACNPKNGSKEEARVLAQKISDVKKREEILNLLK